MTDEKAADGQIVTHGTDSAHGTWHVEQVTQVH